MCVVHCTMWFTQDKCAGSPQEKEGQKRKKKKGRIKMGGGGGERERINKYLHRGTGARHKGNKHREGLLHCSGVWMSAQDWVQPRKRGTKEFGPARAWMVGSK
jgi:hypothetical protein